MISKLLFLYQRCTVFADKLWGDIQLAIHPSQCFIIQFAIGKCNFIGERGKRIAVQEGMSIEKPHFPIIENNIHLVRPTHLERHYFHLLVTLKPPNFFTVAVPRKLPLTSAPVTETLSLFRRPFSRYHSLNEHLAIPVLAV